MLKRYSQLLTAIDLFKPETIVEVGTWNGDNAIRMIRQAQKHRKKVIYIGYDLFEDATDQTDSDELNVKKHFTAAEVEAKILANCPGAEVQLIKGNTRQTLNNIAADFCFIDGGHSVETIESDHSRCAGSAVIIHDDYYVPDGDGKMPDTSLYGCNDLVQRLGDGVVLPLADPVQGGGFTQMVLTFGGK